MNIQKILDRGGKIIFILSLLFLVFFLGYMIFQSLFVNAQFSTSIVNKDIQLVEGVVVNKDFKINKISPVFGSTNDFEKYLSSIIYEPLWDVKKTGEVIPILAEKVEVSSSGLEYTIKLKSNIYFSDGVKLTSDDVLRTYNVAKTLGEDTALTNLLKDVKFEQISLYDIKFTLPKVYPAFYEIFSIGIMPKHILDTDTPIKFRDHLINKKPIGTGRYFISDVTSSKIKFSKNSYYRTALQYDNWEIKLFSSVIELSKALKSGEISIFFNKNSELSNDEIKSISEYNYIYSTDIVSIPNRYWGIYFNLRDISELPNELKAQYSIIQDVNLRRAMNFAVDRDQFKLLLSDVSLRYTVFDETSSVNNGKLDAQFKKADIDKARQILKDNGYSISNDGILTKNNEKIVLTIDYLEGNSKNQILNYLKSVWKSIGIELKLNPRSLEYLNNSVLRTKQFQLLLFGMESTYDPDIYNLWSESAISEVGLNISSFKTSTKIKDPISGAQTSLLDQLLLKARSSLVMSERNTSYLRAQNIISDESPMIYLYNGSMRGFYNKKLSVIKNIDISRYEDRWKILIN